MKKTLNKYKFIIIPFILVYGFFLYVFFTSTTYELTAPGYNSNVSDTFYIENEYDHENEGTFHTTSVIVLNEISLYQKFLAERLHTVDTANSEAFYDAIDLDEYYQATILMKDDSIDTSLIVGLNLLDYDVTYETNRVVYLTYSHLTEDTLQVGDYVLRVNGQDDIDTAMSEVTCDETAEFEIMRDGEVITVYPEKSLVNDRCVFGLYLNPFTELQETEVAYEIFPSTSSGPSGGLMQSLYVFNQLTEFDYTHGLKICGTGTIDTEGNVGYIGGIRQKIITSIGNGCDVYFAPYLDPEYEEDNYINALAAMEEFDSNMILVGVSTIQEAIDYLALYESGDEVE